MKLLLIVFLSSILLIASIPIFVSAVSGGNDGVSRVISVLGIAKVQGEDVIVDILVEVQKGQDPKEVARAALQAQNARPFESASLGSEGFTVTGLVWDTLPVVQNYNPGSKKTEDEPPGLNGQTALTNTHGTWDGVTTSSFDINFGETTDRCPSLVRECKGRQFFDGNNDVAWLKLQESVLGVAWFSTSIDEVDMALSTRFSWNGGCADVANSIDAQTVFLHENGHTVGLGHSDDTDSVMQPFYHGADCDLDKDGFLDDNEGATYLYDTNITGSVSGTITDGTNPIEGATVVLEVTGLSATTVADGIYTISGVPDPVTYTVTASAGGFESQTISRLTVDGAVTANFILTPTGGTGGTGTTVSVSSIVYATEGGRNGDKHLLITISLLDDSENPVSGATVSIDLFRGGSFVGSGTGTTGTDGNVTWTLKNAASGCYTTTVTDVTAEGLTWDGATPENKFCK